MELSAVGMFGNGTGCGIPSAGLTLTIIVGGIGEKPGILDGQITLREYLSLTISFDHDIIDGAPAARFTQRLKELIESGHGLCEFQGERAAGDLQDAAYLCGHSGCQAQGESAAMSLPIPDSHLDLLT